MSRFIDLNADMGEGFGPWRMGDDDALLRVVTSANIACGFHAGDPLTVLRTCEKAAERGVAIGAHVSYRDLVGFGRRYLDASVEELTADVLYQLGALDSLARSAGSRVRYVKPHGALYNQIAHDPVHAAAVVSAVVTYDATLPLLGLPGSEVLRQAADAGLRTNGEAFCDRAYTDDGALVSRRLPNSVLHDPEAIAERSVRMVMQRTVVSSDGQVVPIDADSLCVHGDTPGAVGIAERVRSALEQFGICVRPFVDHVVS